jgi:hypothetical protein
MFVYESVLDIARALNEFDRWCVQHGYDPESAVGVDAYKEAH